MDAGKSNLHLGLGPSGMAGLISWLWVKAPIDFC